jgi:Protein of unknown function (DUF4242)
MTAQDLRAISKTSNAVISVLGRPYTWVQSFVTENKIYCIHEAENEDDIREHAKCADIPVNEINEIKAVIGRVLLGKMRAQCLVWRRYQYK